MHVSNWLLVSKSAGSYKLLEEVTPFTGIVDYPGHYIQLDCGERVWSTVDVIYTLQSATNVTELKLFLCLCSI